VTSEVRRNAKWVSERIRRAVDIKLLAKYSKAKANQKAKASLRRL